VKRRGWCAFVPALLVLLACGNGNSPSPPSASSNLTGTWAGDLSILNTAARMSWVLTQSTNTVAGPVLILMPNGVVLVNGTLSGTLSGLTLTYTIDLAPGGIPSQPGCSGQLGGTVTLGTGQTSTLSGSYVVRSTTCPIELSTGSFVLAKQ
jgi:hypothetical protein